MYRPRLNEDEYRLILSHREKTNTTRLRHTENKVLIPDTKVKILLFDIETAPALSYVWDRWKQNITQDQIVEEGYMLCYCARWLGDDVIMFDALPNHDLYATDPENDYEVCKNLWTLLNEADVVIGHNVDKFDKRVANTRFVYHGMQPPSPAKSVDTLKIAKGVFKFPYNRLDALGDYLGYGRKLETGGFRLWRECMAGDTDAWAKMVEYCARDVELLEKVYMRLRAWDKKHAPIHLMHEDDKMRCRVCGSENVVAENFYFHTSVSSFAAYKCCECGHWLRGRKNIRTKKQNESLITSAL